MARKSSSGSRLFITILAGAPIDFFRRSNIGTSGIAAFFSLGGHFRVRNHRFSTPEYIIASHAWLLSLRRSFIRTVQENRTMCFFKFISLLQSWSELQADNMIPFHGIRSSFGTRLAFSFLGRVACGHQKLVLRPLGGKVFRVDGESGVGAAVLAYCRCFNL